MPATVAIAGEFPLEVAGIQALVSASPELEIVFATTDLSSLHDLANRHKPHLTVLSARIHAQNLQLVRQLNSGMARPRCIVIGNCEEDHTVGEVLQSGAFAYLLHSSPQCEFRKALAEVVSGNRYLAHPFSERAIDAYLKTKERDFKLSKLTNREQDVAMLLSQGLRTGEVAEQLYLSPRTIEHHRAKVLKKLGLASQAQLVRHILTNPGFTAQNTQRQQITQAAGI
jgi:two-component system, NarL family, response regulator NreC